MRLLYSTTLIMAVAAAIATAQTPGDQPKSADILSRIDALARGAGGASDSTRLRQLFDLWWQYSMHEYPEWATWNGIQGENHRWTDKSPEAIARRVSDLDIALRAATSIDSSRLGTDDRVSLRLMINDLRLTKEGARFHGEYEQINQLGGVQQEAPNLLAMMPATTRGEYDDILARLRSLPSLVDQTIALMEKGAASGITPPRITLRDVPAQVLAVIPDDPMSSPLLAPFTHIPSSIPEAERAELSREAAGIYNERVAPAFRKLHDFLVDSYIPRARTSIGVGALPDGADRYAYATRVSTTTGMTPRQIHDIGLAEVKRIRGEMEKVMAQTGFKGDLAAFTKFLTTDERFFFKDAASLLAAYRDIAKRADPELIKLFGKLPRTPYGVIPVPAYSERSQTTAYYNPGSYRAGRPGYFYANTYDLASRPKWEMEALTLHEAVPGHHLQISLADEMDGLPELRKQMQFTAFVEGWGLYSESLGEEMGFYTDPYSKFGQLTYEMWRAIRLVVDTGIHSLGWSREQAIRFFRENSSKTDHDIEVEVDRYIVWPGQALAYKIGEMKIKELRNYARTELGDRFDIREFHDHVLMNGAVPLDVLETQIKAWVAERKKAMG